MKTMIVMVALLGWVCHSNATKETYRTQTLKQPGLIGTLYQPETTGPIPVIVVLGGSGGRVNRVYGPMLAEQGFGVLSLAYFNAVGLPSTLDRLPVETVSHALDYLSSLAWVKSESFGVIGISRGSELAFLAAGQDARIQAVAGIVPSAVAWHGQTGPDAWVVADKPVSSLTFERESGVSIYQRAVQALDNIESVAQASLPFDQIGGPVLLVSAQHDHIWPSTQMAELIETELKNKQFAYPVRHLNVDDDHVLDAVTQNKLKPELLGLFKQLRD